ncbi:MAG: hypothetical protein JNL83_35635 [Myxococcales bacterium]|nr:hypothetical protein [Myxococcales bacterium]
MKTNLLITTATILAAAGTASAQPAPTQITVGIYAPSVDFGTAQARLAYVQGLAKAIEQNTGIKTVAQSYASLGAMNKGGVDFAIIDGQCYAANMSPKLLASANIGGSTTRQWALFSGAGGDMQSLKGKKLSFINTGCNDAGFIDNAMLDSEVDASFFSSRTGRNDLAAAVADVASVKTSQAVFAPVSAGKGLTKVFDTGAVPNPAFVDLSGKVPAATVAKVQAAVVGFGGGGAINGWAAGDRGIYSALSFGRKTKAGILAQPEAVRIDARDVLIDPPTMKDTALVDVRHHFVRPPGARME